MTGRFPQVWDLTSLLPDPATPAFVDKVAACRTALTALQNDSRQLPPVDATHAKDWIRILTAFEECEADLIDLRAHIECYSAAEAQNPLYQKFDAELSALIPAREVIATNLEFAFREASEEDFDAFLKADPWLTERAFGWTLKRQNAKFRLPRELENLANELAVDGLHAWGRLYDRLCGALRVTLIEKGEPVTRSPGQVTLDSPDRSQRENNFYAADKAWKSIETACTESINHIAGTRLTTYRALGLKSHLDLPLHVNRMTRETLDAMWSAIAAFRPKLGIYLERKAGLIGVEKMSWFDQQAPIPAPPGGAAEELSYDRACELIIEAFDQFSGHLGNFARMSLSDGWIEAEDRDGKRQGGFCTSYRRGGQSRIFMTYIRTPDSMSTLAHELGHAYHSYVLKDKPLVHADYPMNLAETASTFAEAVLADSRLKAARTDYERVEMLDGMLGDAMAFLMNIYARFLFEDRFHKERSEGELSAKRLGELMTEAQREAYGNAFADDGWNPRFWVSKLHFYITGVPFYNFPYTFGYLLSMGLYAIGQKEKTGFAERYVRFLEATGCMTAEDAVRSSFGYDLRAPDFWNESLSVIDTRLQQFLDLSARMIQRT